MNALKLNRLILSIYQDFGFENVQIKLATRPEKRVGSDAVWDKAEKALMDAMDAARRHYMLNQGEGAFYGPKLEYTLRDAIGRDWQCGTVQVDLNMPERLGAFYIGADGARHVPVMMHRAIFGSLERFTGILIEHYAGHLPLWLSPVQVVVATIVSDADEYAREVSAELTRGGPERRDRSAQREDQLQGARALPRQGPGAGRGRQARGGRRHRLDPPARQPGAGDSAAHGGYRLADGGGASTRPARPAGQGCNTGKAQGCVRFYPQEFGRAGITIRHAMLLFAVLHMRLLDHLRSTKMTFGGRPNSAREPCGHDQGVEVNHA